MASTAFSRRARGLLALFALAAAPAVRAAPAPPAATGEPPEPRAAEALPPPVSAEEPRSLPQLGLEAAPRRGYFVQTALGAFATAGGSRASSAAQPYLALAAGRDVGERGAVFLQLGVGASRASCFDGTNAACAAADSFGATFAELGVRFGMGLSPRLLLSAVALGGISLLSPSPVAGANGAVPDSIAGPHLGAGAALDYDTHLDHFGVGVDLLARESFARRPAGGTFALLSVALAPRIKYVF